MTKPRSELWSEWYEQLRNSTTDEILTELEATRYAACATGDCPHDDSSDCVAALVNELDWVEIMGKVLRERVETLHQQCGCQWQGFPRSVDGKTHWVDGVGDVECEVIEHASARVARLQQILEDGAMPDPETQLPLADTLILIANDIEGGCGSAWVDYLRVKADDIKRALQTKESGVAPVKR